MLNTRIMQYPSLPHRLFVYISCALTVTLASFLSMIHGVPAVYAPLSLTIVVPYIFVGEFLQIAELAFAIPAVIFLVANYQLIIPSVSNKLPLRNIVVLTLMTVFSIWWHITSYKEAMEWEGTQFYLSMIIMNVLTVGLLGWACYRLRYQANWIQSCIVSTGIFFWIFWSSVPYFGELM